jgi:alcohol dehydrogenase class IV
MASLHGKVVCEKHIAEMTSFFMTKLNEKTDEITELADRIEVLNSRIQTEQSLNVKILVDEHVDTIC